jgi:hypothetical protein
MPNDPFITRNYIGLLMEIGNFNLALKECISLVKVYPFINILKTQLGEYFIWAEQNKDMLKIKIDKNSIEEWKTLTQHNSNFDLHSSK